MFEISKLEFGKWLQRQAVSEMSIYEKTFVGIIIDHFDDIAQCGTTGGARAKLIGSYIEKLGNKAEQTELNMPTAVFSGERVKRLESLTVENFRGFGVEEHFDFSKQYTFYHGPNGSGKTSFCEAIEYSVLGNIAEASARSIPLEKYIAHTGTKKAAAPKLKCVLYDGTIGAFPANLSEYRFAFVEKNRILDFSHIGAATAKTQAERIASLFGLSEFQSFVHDFTDTFDERYITLKSDASEKYQEKKKSVVQQTESLAELETELEIKKVELQKLIDSLSVETVNTADDAIAYLTNDKTGKITIASKEASEHHLEIVNESILENLKEAVRRFLDTIISIQLDNQKILSDVGSVNLSNVFKAIQKLKTSYSEDVCPVCRTPLTGVVENPFEYADNELQKLTQIDTAKKAISVNSKLAATQVKVIADELRKTEICSLFKKVATDTILNASIQAADYEIIGDALSVTVAEIKKLQELLDDTDNLTSSINSYNENASDTNSVYEKKVKELQETYGAITAASASVNDQTKRIETAKNKLEQEVSTVEKLQKAAETAECQIAFNRNMVNAYKSVISNLADYVKKLPIELAANLSGKVKEYYNAINYGDADFELIEELRLPVSSNEKIVVKMKDGLEQDALQILSEGHVKILGLAILLAKAVTEEMPFIVFDDIVNAIDDDHRKGVASLLIGYTDFSQKQMILTCHGELFVTTLEDFVEDKSKMSRYMFLPADTLDERGIVIKYQDSSIPLKVAKEKFQNGYLKDSAAKCRQAVECITGKLWRKISPMSGGISVKLRVLGSSPDLFQVVEGLCKSTKSKEITGCEQLHNILEELRKSSTWQLLNKGTHVDDALPEFSGVEIKELLTIIERLNDEVNNLKLKVAVVDKT